MSESMETVVDEMERAYLDACDGDARDALRRALGDALQELAAVDRQVSRGFVRAGKPADLARKLGPERRARQGQGAVG
ncbi:hypothetical protein ASF27_11895 [Methylobacterium sp. Leaf102]|nr:hypothetical protein ASF25_11730 [Methylobacterium sp. Leaf100]KQP23864.1 hypothetical protein ASF27_11895 [Methylobacterium sp. Leaf102]MBD8904607.1 hypothetical protein [Methylobacterium bullatum]